MIIRAATPPPSPPLVGFVGRSGKKTAVWIEGLREHQIRPL
jgi:hypothetical protein